MLTLAALSPDGGDKDARDSVQMWLEQRLRDGLEDGSVSGQHIGTFERYTKVSSGCLPRAGLCQGVPTGGGSGGGEFLAVGRGLWEDEGGICPASL